MAGGEVAVARLMQFQVPYDGPSLDVLAQVLVQGGFHVLNFEAVDEIGAYVVHVTVYGPFGECHVRFKEAYGKATLLAPTILLPRSVMN